MTFIEISHFHSFVFIFNLFIYLFFIRIEEKLNFIAEKYKFYMRSASLITHLGQNNIHLAEGTRHHQDMLTTFFIYHNTEWFIDY